MCGSANDGGECIFAQRMFDHAFRRWHMWCRHAFSPDGLFAHESADLVPRVGGEIGVQQPGPAFDDHTLYPFIIQDPIDLLQQVVRGIHMTVPDRTVGLIRPVAEHQGRLAIGEHPQRYGKPPIQIKYDTQRVLARPKPRGQLRIVIHGRSGADHNGHLFRPPPMHEPVGSCTCDLEPLSCPPDHAIRGLGPFQDDPRPVLPMKSEEPAIEILAFLLQYTTSNIDTLCQQSLDTPAIDRREWIPTAHHDAGYALRQDQVNTRRRLAMMCAGFQRDVDGGRPQKLPILRLDGAHSVHFRVRSTMPLVISLADDPAVMHDHRTHHGVGRYLACPQGGQLQAAMHVMFVAGHRGKFTLSLRMTGTMAQQELRRMLEGMYDPRESANIADLVMEKVTGMDRTSRVVHKHRELSPEQEADLQRYSEDLQKGRPVQYVIDEAWFAGMPFHVNENVLIPRPETEELVEWAVEELGKNGLAGTRILDMGTGSGCLAISLNKKLPRTQVTAVDKSHAALQVAALNAQELGAQIEFRELDFLDRSTWPSLGTFDLVISNPPYVPIRDKASMAPNVLDHEPHLALFVENDDPLLFFRALAEFGNEHLMEGGLLLCEIHEELGREVSMLLELHGYRNVEIKRDFQGKDRMVIGYRL